MNLASQQENPLTGKKISDLLDFSITKNIPKNFYSTESSLEIKLLSTLLQIVKW